ncbi:MAG: asparagine--tRNA ligase [Bdellovibrionales bacterium]|jgi:asparaginyl-tRNA synthetase|nr:asparagine--tRNA ligase [Bdellovibrionales bacterium]
MEASSIKHLLNGPEELINKTVFFRGWVRSVRKSKAFSFIVVNDGSSQGNMQIIADSSMEGYEQASTMLTGACVEVEGLLVSSEGKGQKVEIQAQKINIVCGVDEEYPLQKKATSMEFLREIAHLRSRTQTFGAVWRIRHHMAMATHKFFDERGFFHIHTPIITALDCEGAGEMFRVSTFDFNDIPKGENGETDFTQDYFGSDTTLTVSGQLQAESMAIGLGKVYTFGPTFRSENSHTTRHLAEFWMVEPEVAFYDLDDVANLAVDYVKYLISYVFEKCEDELNFLNFRPRIKGGKLGDAPNGKENHLDTLKGVLEAPVTKITYTEAIDILKNSGENFDFKPEWGIDVQTEHERYLAETHFNGPVIVTDYPKDIKAFYMKQNSDGKTVRAMDLLVPGIGEIIGGSQREDDLEKLNKVILEKGMNDEDLWWYKELRKWGSCPHSGFGLGFERAVQYITGMGNIRDVIPFPRTPKSAQF